MMVLAPSGLVTQVKRLNFQAVTKLSASEASPTAWGVPGRWPRLADNRLRAAQAVVEAALAADLITA